LLDRRSLDTRGEVSYGRASASQSILQIRQHGG
jgi:hypothetical protein